MDDNETLICPNTDLLASNFDFAVNGVLSSLTVISGLIGTMYCLYHLIERIRDHRSRLVRFAIVLSLWDMGLLAGTAGLYSVAVLCYGHKPYVGPATYLYPVFYPLVKFTMTGSLWMVTLMTYERSLAVSKPLLQQIRESKSVKWSCLVIGIGSALLNMPSTFELKLSYCYDLVTERFQPILSESWLRHDPIYLLTYRVVCYLLFVSPLPFMVVLILSLRILFYYRMAVRWRTGSLSSSQNVNDSNNTTVLMTAVIVKFLSCYTLPTTVNIMELVLNRPGGSGAQSESFYRLVDVSNFLVVLHSATNWIIFSRFRGKSSHNRNRLTRKQSSFSRTQTTELCSLWNKQDATDVGTKMLLVMFAANPDLAMPLLQAYTTDENNIQEAGGSFPFDNLTESGKLWPVSFETIPEIPAQGCRIGAFLDDIVQSIVQKEDPIEIRDKLRHVGEIHSIHNVNLQNSDWLLVKNYVIERLVDQSSNRTSSQTAVANKFVSFLIREMKAGFQNWTHQCNRKRCNSHLQNLHLENGLIMPDNVSVFEK